MTDFNDFDVIVEDNNKNQEIDDEFTDNYLDSLKSFIDDIDEMENDRTFYQKFERATTSIDDTLKQEYDKSIVDIQKIDVSKHLKKKWK